MSTDPPLPPLKMLHPEDCLIPLKLAQLDRLSTEDLVQSLAPGQPDCLKTRPDGTIIDGNHRIHILRKRAIDVDALPRQILIKEDL
jgi:hypothetical protein